MTAPVLEARRLRKRFGGLVVTNDVDLTLAAGARHALIGPNGAGKTTLVNLLSGVLRADAGEILLSGRDVSKADVRGRVRAGLVRTFQINNLFARLSVRENVLLALQEYRGTSRRMMTALDRDRDLFAHADAILVSLRLDDEADRPVKELAYGRQRLVEVAIALALEPRVLILDEPAAGIPAAEAEMLLRVIDALPASMAILLIEHDMSVVRRFARAVTVLVQGEVLATGVPEDVMSRKDVRRVYLGESESVFDGHHESPHR